MCTQYFYVYFKCFYVFLYLVSLLYRLCMCRCTVAAWSPQPFAFALPPQGPQAYLQFHRFHRHRCRHLTGDTWIDSQAIGKNFVRPRDTNSLLFSVSRSPNHTLIMKVQMPVSPAEDTALEMSQTHSHWYDQMIRLCFCLLILAHAKSKSCIKTMGTCKIPQTLPKQTNGS